MTARIDTINVRINKHDTRLQELKTRTSTTEDELTTQDKRAKRMEAELLHVAATNEDLEGRSRRNNIRIVGVVETTNTGPMSTYVVNVLTEVFGRESFSTCFLVECAHRLLGPRPPMGAPPRPAIARLLNYHDRVAVLRLVREAGQVH